MYFYKELLFFIYSVHIFAIIAKRTAMLVRLPNYIKEYSEW